jgi:hypothetical protein
MAALGTADDIHGADGSAILNFAHALTKAAVWEPDQVTGLPTGPVTVAYTVTHYLEWFKQHRRSYNRVKARADYSILPKLGPLRVDALTPLA